MHYVGTLTKPHGVCGELNFVFDDDVWDEVEADHLMIMVDGLLVPFFIEEYRFRNDSTALVKFEDVDDEQAARQYAGCKVYIERSLLPTDRQAQCSWSDFEGLRVVTNARTLGTITEVDDATENVLFTITTPDGKEHLVPAAEDLISDIDWEAREMAMVIPEGLLEI